MGFAVYLLALATFATGTAENIVIGILPDVAAGLGVPVALAGQLTAVFSITFALTAPLALMLTRHMRRKHMLAAALVLFIASNFLAAASQDFWVLFAARVGMAAASATACLVATMLATEAVSPDMRGRAIGVIFMGVSGSLVLGVPVGMVICDLFGWRSVFVALALLAGFVLAVCHFVVPSADARSPAESGYARHLSALPLVCAQLVSILMIGGHFVLFAYLAPYIAGVVGVEGRDLVLAFVAFGVAGVSGGYLGGLLSDRLGPRAALLLTPLAYLAALLAIPAVAGGILFFAVMMAWACISWMISPVVQNFLMATDPQTAAAGVSLNLSAMHVGVGLGTAAGGALLGPLPLQALPWAGSMLAALAVVSAAMAFRGTGKGSAESVDAMRDAPVELQ
jgi:DHA1 family purine base/nucleoside efflux pump-like MFS transporter